MKGAIFHIVVGVVVFLSISCDNEKISDNHSYVQYESRGTGKSTSRFTLLLFKDSTFIYEIDLGSGNLDKEIGRWHKKDGLITLTKGTNIQNQFTVSYQIGESDSLTFDFDESIIKDFPDAKIILYDTAVIAVRPHITISKKNYFFARDMGQWNNFNSYFVSDIKFISGSDYLLFFNFSPTNKIIVASQMGVTRLKEERQNLFIFKENGDDLTLQKSFVKFSVNTLYRRYQHFNKEIAIKVDSLFQIDTKMVASLDSIAKIDSTNVRINELTSKINTNNITIEPIVRRFNYPGFDLIGNYGSYQLWVLVQHLDKHVDFQEYALEMLFQQVQRQNASSQNYAFLSDRISINKGGRQRYGTQVYYDVNGVAKVKPIEVNLKVDSLRLAIGLDSLQSYLNFMTLLHLPPGKKLAVPITITLPQ